MSDSLNNKELVAVGHQFAKAISSDTAIMDIAKIVSRLAERLDCSTAALLKTTKQRDALAAENPLLKNFIVSDSHMAHFEPETFYEEEVARYVSADGYEPETPAADAVLAEVRASGLDEMAIEYRKFASEEGCSCNLQSSYNLTAERAESYGFLRLMLR